MISKNFQNFSDINDFKNLSDIFVLEFQNYNKLTQISISYTNKCSGLDTGFTNVSAPTEDPTVKSCTPYIYWRQKV